MRAAVDLILTGEGAAAEWPLGEVVAAGATPSTLAERSAEHAQRSSAAALLFWDPALGPPDPQRIARALERPGDVWHAGLALGLGGLPQLLDCVHPTWMLHRDPPAAIEATSWRLSLRACLARREVVARLGGPRRGYRTLAGASLELGHRWLLRGALPRHLPWLFDDGVEAGAVELPLEDELRFLNHRFGDRWLRWGVLRGVASGSVRPTAAWKAHRRVRREPRLPDPPPLRNDVEGGGDGSGARVTVLVPTLDRYRELSRLLDQLARQTVAPLEVVVVDQTPPSRRRGDLAADHPELPLRLLHRDTPGQCSSRNAGLAAARGELVLFLDDDDEVPPDLVARHLATLERFAADVSVGIADEVGAGRPEEVLRAADTFPTNNALVRRSALERSGLFDLAYERGERADADLGMRLYLGGALMVLDPANVVLHHRAPAGGLRSHGARRVTYAASRRRLLVRHLPSATELYFAKRYFTPRQVRERLWLAAGGTLALRGGAFRRWLKVKLGLLLLPHSLWRLRRAARQAERMLGDYPRIPPAPSSWTDTPP